MPPHSHNSPHRRTNGVARAPKLWILHEGDRTVQVAHPARQPGHQLREQLPSIHLVSACAWSHVSGSVTASPATARSRRTSTCVMCQLRMAARLPTSSVGVSVGSCLPRQRMRLVTHVSLHPQRASRRCYSSGIRKRLPSIISSALRLVGHVCSCDQRAGRRCHSS